MFKIKLLENKYRYRFDDDLVPFEFNNLKENIKDLSCDIFKIKSILLQHKAKDIVNLCNDLCVKLCYKLDYFQKRFEIIEFLNEKEKNLKFENYYTDQY